MSVGSARQRGQEGRLVLFPQQDPHCITVVCQTQVCLERALDLTERDKKEKSYNNKPQRQSHKVCLSKCQHIDYRGLFCGSDFVTTPLLLLCMFKYFEVLVWQTTQELQPSQELGLC